MMALASILNPPPPERDEEVDPAPTLGRRHQQLRTPPLRGLDHAISPSKRVKISRNWSVDMAEETSQTIARYPPYEVTDNLLRRRLVEFRVTPACDNIRSTRRHIPYNSEKKTFFEKTGRESFEVFSYDFWVPGDNKQYTIMWDYELGFVRTTAIFKACGFQKTTPARMLQNNPGLRELCHSITGGALLAQGYWIPYDAARAVAATFAWHIREVLVPIFGQDFPAICTPRIADSSCADMRISPHIIERCAEEARTRLAEQKTWRKGGQRTPLTPVSQLTRGDRSLPSTHNSSRMYRPSSQDYDFALTPLQSSSSDSFSPIRRHRGHVSRSQRPSLNLGRRYSAQYSPSLQYDRALRPDMRYGIQGETDVQSSHSDDAIAAALLLHECKEDMARAESKRLMIQNRSGT